MPRAKGLLAAALLGTLVGLPTALYGWGTFTRVPTLTKDEQDKIDVVSNYARAGKEAFLKDFEARKGPHPVHQFICYKAFQLLKQDPAFSDGRSGFPDIDSINRWDGIYRTDKGPAKRLDADPNPYPLAPAVGSEYGPGADADLCADVKTYNPYYDGAAHYWNPWLKSGRAPLKAGTYYADLVDAIADGKSEIEKAQYAHYMAHYVADVASAKHADAFYLPEETTRELEKLADELWDRLYKQADVRRSATGEPLPFQDQPPVVQHWFNIDNMLRQREVPQAYAILRAATVAAATKAGDPKIADAYWDRVQKHIETNGLMNVRSGWRLDMKHQSIESAVLAYLHGYIERPRSTPDPDDPYQVPGPEKPLQPYFGYFDPFYFNGPLFDFNILANLGGYVGPVFALATPAGEHLIWETNPFQDRLVATYAPGPVRQIVGAGVLEEKDLAPERNYEPFTVSEDFYNINAPKRSEAMRGAMEQLVMQCSSRAHGDLHSGQDFDHGPDGFQKHMGIAIKHVFTAFRASITALRVDDVKVTYFGKENKTTVRCQIRNQSLTPADLDRVVLSANPPLGPMASNCEPYPEQRLKGKKLKYGETMEFEWEIQHPNPNARYTVDLHGTYPGIPDCGWYRASDRQGASIVEGTGGLVSRVQNLPSNYPVDVAFVVDSSAYMADALAEFKARARSLLQELKQRNPDLRVGVVRFTDARQGRLEVGDLAGTNEGKVFARWLDAIAMTSNMDQALAAIEGLQAQFGSREGKCSAVAGLRWAIKYWEGEPENPGRRPAKILVLVTKNTPYDPEQTDAVLTKEIVAFLAQNVDPAHIYPVIVGSNTEALAAAKELASSTDGQVINVTDVKNLPQALLDAAQTGIRDHPVRPPLIAAALFYGGLVVLALGAFLTFSGGPASARRVAAATRHCTSCGKPLRLGAPFCNGCGARVS